MKKIIYIVAIVVIAVIVGVLMLNRSSNVDVQTPADTTVSTEVTPEATVGIEAVTPVTTGAATALSGSKTVTWQTSSVGTVQTVDINLLKKVSDSPISYTFVRKIATNTVNDGNEIWTPKAGETSKDLYIEVTCSSTGSIAGCKVSGSPLLAN